MDSNKLGFLGLLRRAGKVTIGCDPVRDNIVKGSAKAVFMAEDISKNTKKTVLRCAKEYSVHSYIMKCSKSELSHALGKQAAVISVDDEKAASSVAAKLADDKEECQYDD